MANIIITGGTGLVGTELTDSLLLQGHVITILTRTSKPSEVADLHFVKWDLNDKTINPDLLSKADYIIHLAGANVGEKRWSEKRKQEIISSRVKSGELIARSLEKIPNKVKTVISASAIGWYGEDKGKPFVETDLPASDYLGQVCKKWEEAVHKVELAGARLVIFRFGLVLSRKGGAYAEFRKPYRFGLSTILGSGRQVISWIHIDDAVRMIAFAVENDLFGIYNGVAPEPVTNKELNKTIRRQINKWRLPVRVPAAFLKLGLGEMSVGFKVSFGIF